jgi:hypothetical protein
MTTTPTAHASSQHTATFLAKDTTSAITHFPAAATRMRRGMGGDVMGGGLTMQEAPSSPTAWRTNTLTTFPTAQVASPSTSTGRVRGMSFRGLSLYFLAVLSHHFCEVFP